MGTSSEDTILPEPALSISTAVSSQSVRLYTRGPSPSHTPSLFYFSTHGPTKFGSQFMCSLRSHLAVANPLSDESLVPIPQYSLFSSSQSLSGFRSRPDTGIETFHSENG